MHYYDWAIPVLFAAWFKVAVMRHHDAQVIRVRSRHPCRAGCRYALLSLAMPDY